jgi:hypothetical protein
VHLYSADTKRFLQDVRARTIAAELQQRFFQEYRFAPPDGEVRAWTNSLEAMARVVERAALDDHGVLIEYQLPLTSRRLDCMFTGHASRGASAVIVELKQWDYVLPSWVDECVCTTVGMRERDVLHPSAQVAGYRRYLLDTNTAFAGDRIDLKACSYLHNLQKAAATALFDPHDAGLRREAPVFTRDDEEQIGEFLGQHLAEGGGNAVLEAVVQGRFRPHKSLLEHTASAIRNEPAWELLDEQRVAFNAVLTSVRERHEAKERTVFLVRGGPGTGKSVVAINLVAALSELGFATLHTTGSRAFTENLRKVVGRRASAQFKYFNSLADAGEREIDIVVSDEAHRLREFSWNWRTPKRLRTELTQTEEIIRSAGTAVFFIDDMQVVRPSEVGSSELIRRTASELGRQVIEFELEAQFRCGGSEAFVAWVENTLEIRRTANVLWDAAEEFEFVVLDTVGELEEWVRSRARGGFTARLSAGFCWPWSVPRPDGTLVDDVRIGDWSMPWNAKPDAAKLAPGIPKSNYWATDPAGIDQVGCIYTAQGFEYDYAGVIFGRDLVYRANEGWVGRPEYSHDSVVKREAKEPEQFARLAKNAYRVLLTRGLRGCAIFFEDEPTRDFVLSRME